MSRLAALGSFTVVALGMVIVAALVAGGCRSNDPAPGSGGSSAAPAAAPPAGSPPSSATATFTAKGPSTVHTFEIPLSADASRPKVRVSIQLPASWTVTTGADGAPSFAASGLTGPSFGLAAVSTDEADPAARIEQAFKWQYDDPAGVSRSPLPGGRLWASRVEGKITHARVFVAVPGGVVMGVAMLRGVTDAQLAEIRAAFETLAAKE
jgi:hypothetical protein